MNQTANTAVLSNALYYYQAIRLNRPLRCKSRLARAAYSRFERASRANMWRVEEEEDGAVQLYVPQFVAVPVTP